MTEKSENRMLSAALRYAAIDWKVFPVTTEGKRKAPHHMLGGRGTGGYKQASSDPEVIRKWWSRDPDAGIGVAMDASGLIAVDVDPRDGGDATLAALETRHGRLDTAVVQATGGGGTHLLFTPPAGVTIPGSLGPGIQIKHHGYVIVTPSLHESGKRYAWAKGKSPFTAAGPIPPAPAWVVAGDRHGNSHIATQPNGQIHDNDDPFAEVGQKVNLGIDEIRARLAVVPAENYDIWRGVGMALNHQYDGGTEGLALWHEWSATAGNYNSAELDKRWPGFTIEGKGRKPVTASWILKLATEHGWRAPEEAFQRFQAALSAATDKAAVLAAAHDAKTIDMDGPTRVMAASLVQTAFKRVTGVRLSAQQTRDMVCREETKRKRPAWLTDWCYCTSDDRFYNWTTRATMSRQAFDAAHTRFLLTAQNRREGRSAAEQLASNIALNLYQVPVVQGKIYMPGEEQLFTLSGVRYVNSYTNRSVPVVPTVMTERDRENVAIVQNHFNHLFADDRDRHILLDWFCYIIQTCKRPNFACMIQGVEGDGKSFLGMMMGMVMGSENVRLLNAKNIEGEFNGWAEGQILAVIEEVKMHGHNRYDVLNQIKPLITNAVVDIRRMRTDPYNVPNTTAYLLLTNFRDALPLTENDSRYFVVTSRWQTRVALDAFNTANPTYYDRLYKSIDESPGAIRGWLLSRPLSDDFKPAGRAPRSVARGYMVKIGKPEEMEAIEDMIAESTKPDRSNTLLNATDVISELVGIGQVVQTRTINKMLSDAGFTYLGRFRVEGVLCRYWSKKPEQFAGDTEREVAVKIRDWSSSDL